MTKPVDEFWEDDAVEPSDGDDTFWEADAIDPTERPRPKTAIGDSMLRGAAQGVSGGWIDEATAAVGGAIDAAGGPLDFDTARKGWLSTLRRKDDEAQADNPVAFGGSQLVGAVGSGFVPGTAVAGLGKLGTTGAKVAAALTKAAPTTLKARAAVAAAGGGVAGAGMSKADPRDSPDALGEFAADTLLGAATGGGAQAAIGKAAPIIAKQAKKVPDVMKYVAERRAFKAANGNNAKVMQEAQRQGRVNKIGRDLLDDGVVRFGSSARSIQDRAGQKVDEAWEGMKELFDQVDQVAPGSVEGKGAAAKIRAYVAEIGGTGNKPLVKRLTDAADELEGLGNISMAKGQVEKNSWEFTPGDPSSVPAKVANKVRGIIGDEMETGVERYAARGKAQAPDQFAEVLRTGSGTSMPSTGAVLREAQAVSPEQAKALERYKGLKSKYGNMATVEDAAASLANRQEKNQTFGLGAKIMAAAQLAADPSRIPQAAMTALGTKVVQERGSSMAAVTLDKVADVLRRSPEALGPKWGPILASAARRGNSALAATYLVLMKRDPAFAEFVQNDFGGAAP